MSKRLVELHRYITDPLPGDEDTRLAIDPDDIRQVHVGKGGVTIITTSQGKLAVEEDYDAVVAMKEGAADDDF